MLCVARRRDRVMFVDPDDPPPGLDLSRLPAGVDVNDLVADEMLGEGELEMMADAESVDGGALPTEADLRHTVDIIQGIVDGECFNLNDSEQ